MERMSCLFALTGNVVFSAKLNANNSDSSLPEDPPLQDFNQFSIIIF